jgi:hypothetical protein
LLLRAFIKKVNVGSAASQLKAYINTSPDLSGTPIQILIFNVGTTTQSVGIQRSIWIIDKTGAGSGTTIYNTGNSVVNDVFSSNATISSLAIDWTIQQYVIFTFTNTSTTDTVSIAGSNLSPVNGVRGLTGLTGSNGSSGTSGSNGSSGTSGSNGSSGTSGSNGTNATFTAYTFEAYVSDTTTKNKLMTTGNWTSGKYTGPSITGTLKGQKFYSATMSYMYEAVDDNDWIRTLIS